MLIFSILIFVHELGHFLAARKFGVTVDEFSIGMGPKIWSKLSRKTKTRYSIRLLPIGGYVSMPGENGTSEDPNALCNKSIFKRFIVICSGALMNILLAILVMTVIVITSDKLGSTTIHSFDDNAQSEATGLMIGDTILEVGGTNVHIADDLSYEIMRNGIKPIDITVRRAGKVITIENVRFDTTSESGAMFAEIDFKILEEPKSFTSVIKHSFYRSCSTVTIIWESLIDLVTGRYGLDAVSGPVGVTSVISDTARTGGISELSYLFVLISMNLGIFNLLPLPALDGGRLLFLLVEAVRRRPIDPELEAKIHTAGIIALMVLMAVVTYKDIARIFVN